MSLFSELRRRNVFRVGIAYAVIAWFIIQAADIMLANFGAPVRAILRVAVDDGRPVGDAARVFAAPNLTDNAAYDLDPDGQSLLAVQIDADAIPREIRVITNFFDEIRRVAGEGSRP